MLAEGKKIESQYPDLVLEYSLQLKDLYKRTGRQEDYEKELWRLLLQYDLGDLGVYKELKALYTEEEWKRQREVIFNSLFLTADAGRLYKEEHLYDWLLQFVLDSPGLHELQTCETCLEALYPAELLAKYAAEIDKMARVAGDRKHYRDLMNLLRKMSRYPGGQEKAHDMASRWRTVYKMGPAMMDELNQLQISPY